MTTSYEIEQLAATIGEIAYIEVAKWRLYLNDAHLHTAVAEGIAPLLEANQLDRRGVFACLEGIPVTLGSGKTLPLTDLIPDRVITQLWEVLEEM
ncbi:MAG: DUF3181 family protein [Cyanobacteria bacterium KgW148]|nr:DUF3181 family protein [Cyanobacteria bacterium KgW148]